MSAGTETHNIYLSIYGTELWEHMLKFCDFRGPAAAMEASRIKNIQENSKQPLFSPVPTKKRTPKRCQKTYPSPKWNVLKTNRSPLRTKQYITRNHPCPPRHRRCQNLAPLPPSPPHPRWKNKNNPASPKKTTSAQCVSSPSLRRRPPCVATGRAADPIIFTPNAWDLG